jgi:hypothetical protein
MLRCENGPLPVHVSASDGGRGPISNRIEACEDLS